MKNLAKIFLVLFSLGIFFVAPKALAADEIDVEYPVGTNIGGDNIFDEDNIYPGWSETKTIRVRNASTTDDVNLYFTFAIDGNTKLAEKLKLYVVRVSNGSYRIGGAGDRWTLKEADDENLYVDKLDRAGGVNDSRRYEIKIKFDEGAGNEYQKLETDFDIDFAIESEAATEGLTETEILAAQGRTVTGAPPAVEGITAEAGEEAPGVAGVETVCSEWPLWVWILLLIIYAAVFNYSSFRQGLENKIHWFFPALETAVIFALWYFFEKCRLYHWYPYAIVIIALISYFIYLPWFRKKSLEPDFKDEEKVK